MRDYREPHHLPNVRAARGEDAALPEGLPRQRRGTTPQLVGRYPDYDVLDEHDAWDEATRRVVLSRIGPRPPLAFFSDDEAAALSAFADVVLHQPSEPRVPVVSLVDEKLAAGRLEGYRYADLPDDPVTWRRVAAGLDEAARARGADRFAALDEDGRERVVGEFAEGRLAGGWEGLDVSRAWKVVMRDLIAAFYSHPWSWSEIGFGGPAYPRGYARLGIGLSEAWEGEEAFALDPVGDVRARHLE